MMPYRIEPGEFSRLNIYLIGCGGTGSFLALHVARLAWAMRDRDTGIAITFVDGDDIEAKNVGRQNFCPAEIGYSKSLALAARYNAAFGLRIRPVVGFFRADDFERELHHLSIGLDNLVVILGAVDGPSGRREIARVMDTPTRRKWWIDGGNDHESGQILIGNGHQVVISETGFCSELPRPDIQEPGLLTQGGGDGSDDLSCADLLVRDAQNLMINQVMAGWMANYLYRLVLARDLDLMRTEIDLGGTARSDRIRGGQISRIDGDRAGPPLLDMEICPRCGAGLADGRDTVDGFEVDIIFCPACDWRPEEGE
jgi:PRTRC genetic system ThiF family protein